MLEIGLEKSHKGVFQKDIAVNQEISLKYLDQIIPALKASGLISNAKGKKSGYILTREPSEITMYDIHKAFETDISIVPCLSKDGFCDRKKECAVFPFWNGLNNNIIDYMKNYTLQDIINNQLIKRGVS